VVSAVAGYEGYREKPGTDDDFAYCSDHDRLYGRVNFRLENRVRQLPYSYDKDQQFKDKTILVCHQDKTRPQAGSRTTSSTENLFFNQELPWYERPTTWLANPICKRRTSLAPNDCNCHGMSTCCHRAMTPAPLGKTYRRGWHWHNLAITKQPGAL
jgi:hypothetical protein